MKIYLTIEQADNGMIVRFDEDVKVIENTHSAEEGRKDNLVHELGRIFFQHIISRHERRADKRGESGDRDK